MTRSLALKGRTFGRLRVIGQAASSAAGATRWVCECSCGAEKVVNSTNLLGGRVQSCGCLRADSAFVRASRRPSKFITGTYTPPQTIRSLQRQATASRKVPVTLAPVKLPESEDVG